jgi:hypothetical protein
MIRSLRTTNVLKLEDKMATKNKTKMEIKWNSKETGARIKEMEIKGSD